MLTKTKHIFAPPQLEPPFDLTEHEHVLFIIIFVVSDFVHSNQITDTHSIMLLKIVYNNTQQYTHTHSE